MMSEMAQEKGQPFPASWIDRLNDWIAARQVRPWIIYLAAGLLLIVVQLVVFRLDSGGLDVGELLPVIVFNALAVPYLLAVIELTDRLALSAIETVQPMLDAPGDEVEAVAYRISTMPVLPPLAAGLLMGALALLTPLVSIEPASYAVLQGLAMFTAVFRLIDVSSAFLFGVIIYHTIRQLRLVNTINGAVRLDLFHLKPAQAFSRLTAATSLLLLLFFYGWMAINPELLGDPLLFGYAILLTGLSVLIFIWPLWGVHRRLEAQKEDALLEIGRRFEALFAQFNQRLAAGDYAAADELNGLIASMDIQQRRLEDIPTWPWRSETARLLLTAVALPLILMVVQFFVQQALG